MLQEQPNISDNSLTFFGRAFSIISSLGKYFEPRQPSDFLLERCLPQDLLEIARRLSVGELSPNARDSIGNTVLRCVILFYGKENIEKTSPLLLRYGGDLNLLDKAEEGQRLRGGPLTSFLDKNKFTPALAKLFLTYGADYKVYQPFVHKSNIYLIWFVDHAETYYPVSQLLKQADQYFQNEQYNQARQNYEEAIPLLGRFAAEDEEKKDDPEYGRSYAEEYYFRIERCREKIQQCQQQIDKFSDESTNHEQTPLLKKQR